MQIAFNLIPHIDDFLDNGYTKEEMKLVWETRKILGDDNIQVNPTAVRVPVFYGHSEAVHIETPRQDQRRRGARAAGSARRAWRSSTSASRRLPDAGHACLRHATRSTSAASARTFSHPRGLNLWVVSDNIRKGAALNAVQIAELVAEERLNGQRRIAVAAPRAGE